MIVCERKYFSAAKLLEFLEFKKWTQSLESHLIAISSWFKGPTIKFSRRSKEEYMMDHL